MLKSQMPRIFLTAQRYALRLILLMSVVVIAHVRSQPQTSAKQGAPQAREAAYSGLLL